MSDELNRGCCEALDFSFSLSSNSVTLWPDDVVNIMGENTQIGSCYLIQDMHFHDCMKWAMVLPKKLNDLGYSVDLSLCPVQMLDQIFLQRHKITISEQSTMGTVYEAYAVDWDDLPKVLSESCLHVIALHKAQEEL